MLQYDEIIHSLLNIDKKIITVVDYKLSGTTHLFTIKGSKNSCVCPNCNRPTTKRKDRRETTIVGNYKHLYLSNDTSIDLSIIRRYFKCSRSSCGGVSFMERFPFEAERWEHTKDFEKYVIYAWWHMSGNQIAKDNKCSPRRIWSILNTIDKDWLNKEGLKVMQTLDEIRLGIDEHSFKWKDMILVITDVKAKKVLWVLNSISKASLQEWLNELPMDVRNKIKWITTDMNKTYQQTVLQNLPWLQTSIDKYHLVQEANRMVDDVRQLNTWLMKFKFMNEEEIIAKWNLTKAEFKKKLAGEKK